MATLGSCRLTRRARAVAAWATLLATALFAAALAATPCSPALAAPSRTTTRTFTPAPAQRRSFGGVGLDHQVTLQAVYGTGSRWGMAGSQFLFRAETAAMFRPTPAGNLGGIEASFLIGYDSAPFLPGDGVAARKVPLELAVGFPVTLLDLGPMHQPTVRVSVAPGMGFNWLSAFTYLRGKAGVRLGSALVVEAMWQWRPAAASYAFGTGEERGINAAVLRGSLFYRSDRKASWEVFVERAESQREWTLYHDEATAEAGGNSDPSAWSGRDPFGRTVRVDFERFWRLGVGRAF